MRRVVTYGLYIWVFQAMRVIDEKIAESSLKKTSQEDETKEGDKRGEDKEILEVPLFVKTIAMSVEIGTAVNVHVFNMSACL